MTFTYDGLVGSAAVEAKKRDLEEFGPAFVEDRRAVVPVDIEARRRLWREAKELRRAEIEAGRDDAATKKARLAAERQRNIEERGIAYATYPIEKIKRITEMRESGMLDKEIAAAWGVTPPSISSFCIRWGIPKFDAQSPAYRRAKSGVTLKSA